MKEILQFLNEHKHDYEAALAEPPYCVKVNRDGDYFLLKYDMLASDFTNPIVRQCRGSIFRFDGDEIICVCAPFYKFANYGESYADAINWNSVSVQEKVDGSLMKMWYDRDEWHLSTNSTIDAFKATAGNGAKTFGELFVETCGGARNMERLCKVLPGCYTYMFELVHPLAPLTVHYDHAFIAPIGIRSMYAMYDWEEVDPMEYRDLFYPIANSYMPSRYRINSLSEAIAAASKMSKDEEGFVVVDNDYHRIKVKSPEFLEAFHFINNGVITIDRVIEAIRGGYLDDMIAYVNDYQREFIQKVIDAIAELKAECAHEDELTYALDYSNKKEFAMLVQSFKYKDFLLKFWDNPDLTIDSYFDDMRQSCLKKLIKEKI